MVLIVIEIDFDIFKQIHFNKTKQREIVFVIANPRIAIFFDDFRFLIVIRIFRGHDSLFCICFNRYVLIFVSNTFGIAFLVAILDAMHATWYQPSLRVPRAGTRLTVHRPLQVGIARDPADGFHF